MLNTRDKVKIVSGDFQGKIGEIRARHFNIVPGEISKLKAGMKLTGRDNETLFSVRIEKEKDDLYFSESGLELIPKG